MYDFLFSLNDILLFSILLRMDLIISSKSFSKNLDIAIESIYKATGTLPKGFRAPNFDIKPNDLWAYEELAKRFDYPPMNIFRSILTSRGWSKIKIKDALRLPEKKLSKRDQEEFIRFSKEYSDLKPIISNINKFNDLNKEIKDLQNLVMENDDEIAQIAKKELQEVQEQFELAKKNLKSSLVPKDPLDEKNVINNLRYWA